MICPCDGCGRIFEVMLETVNAKQWDPTHCNVPLEDSRDCARLSCEYNLGGECCAEWQFCDECLADKNRVDAVFLSGAEEQREAPRGK
jgi:hypothetical protein